LGELADRRLALGDRLLGLLLTLMQVVEAKSLSITRLKRMCFGSSTDARLAGGQYPPGWAPGHGFRAVSSSPSLWFTTNPLIFPPKARCVSQENGTFVNLKRVIEFNIVQR
jgi:hypothetical protein